MDYDSDNYDSYNYDSDNSNDSYNPYENLSYNAKERLGPVEQDPWITKMTNLPSIFDKFVLSVETLKNFQIQPIFDKSNEYQFSNTEIKNNLNPLALSLSFYVRKSDGSIDKEKLSEIKNILISDENCISDKTCKTNIYYSLCKNNKCIYPNMNLGAIFRYVEIWNKIYNTKNKEKEIDYWDGELKGVIESKE
jgi:hypothetical protein